MDRVREFARNNPKKLFVWSVILLLFVLLFYSYKSSGFSLEEFITKLWEEHVERWGYLILFCWGILEGELGLIFAGLAVHDGKMDMFLAIFIAGLGGFVGDQIYFYIGRLNRSGIQKSFKAQRRQFALAHLLLQKYGWSIIFIQRYMYGMRTIIPISIGTTRYHAGKFALINFLSAQVWAAITICITWYFGEEIFMVLDWFKDHPYLLIVLALVIGGGVVVYFKTQTKRVDRSIKRIQTSMKEVTN
ncbi:MAG: DedA family protein [Helicobacter sp.]|uniref:DedA family protein n=1 Tax=Helicobacter sp. 10-6591 TaxID=2004998 RepID=UPI000DCE3B89|nr:DedA family protein [Helicobacter sp. 10-6591]MCI6217265.1 DedA family protein [Helicobacter sp.]MCI7484471.1 DedA family protein [Helicobacter sp.]MDD7566940.1 DedA family protein [Helicobacter sp.]MDY5740634.1 DedA family protein [Helicobacter sp.]RAX54554.1 DedA family protein [Helicobacter sp. 10-6591]